MPENKTHPQAHSEVPFAEKAESKGELKNQNPNQNHNVNKVSLGPNTKR